MIPLEDEHEKFSLNNDEFNDYFNFLKSKENLEYEDVVSGRGIENLYEYISVGKKLSAKEISELSKEDEIAKETIRTFVKLLNIVIKHFSDKFGVEKIVLTGGVIQKNVEVIEEHIDSNIIEILKENKTQEGLIKFYRSVPSQI